MMQETKTLSYNNQDWKYVVHYRQQKHMYLKLNLGVITISAPFFVKTNQIEDFILKNMSKINNWMEAKAKIIPKMSLSSDAFTYFLDKKLKIVMKYQKRTKMYFTNEHLFIYSPYILEGPSAESNVKQLTNNVNNFLKKISLPILKERLRYYENILNLRTKEFNVRLMKAKWGVCFPNEAKIILNYKLIHFSYQVIDYVVIHELIHLVHPNHSPEFWNLVEKYIPDFQQCKDILKYSNVGLSHEIN